MLIFFKLYFQNWFLPNFFWWTGVIHYIYVDIVNTYLFINSFASIYTSDNMFNIQNVWRIHVQVVTSKNCVVNKHMRVLQNAKDFNNFAYIKFCLKNNRFYRISAYHFFFAALATPIIFCLNANLLYFCR